MYIDPRKEPNRWLTAVMLDLLTQNTHDSRSALADGIRTAVSFLEPGCIDQLFGTWIDAYVDLLAEEKMQKNKHPRPCSPKDQLGFVLQLENPSITDHPDTADDTK